MVLETELCFGAAERESYHLRHVEDRKLYISSHSLGSVVLLDIHIEVAERAWRDDHIGVVVDSVHERCTREPVRCLRSLEIDMETAALVLALVVYTVTLEGFDESVERCRDIRVLAAVALVLELARADVVASVERSDIVFAQRRSDLVADRFEAVVVDEGVEEVFDLARTLVLETYLCELLIDPRSELCIMVELVLGHRGIDLAGVADRHHREAMFLCVADVPGIEDIREELVEVLEVARAAAACLVE